jgi:hypothetical protein
MEAWLKFRAEGVTLPLGLGIGKLVFGALNKVEWFLATVVFIGLILQKSVKSYYFFGIIISLLLQTFWLLPILNHRADAIISGKTLLSSNFHFYYIAVEIIKLSLLMILGFKKFDSVQLKKINV